jgi:hypothetical protein
MLRFLTSDPLSVWIRSGLPKTAQSLRRQAAMDSLALSVMG